MPNNHEEKPNYNHIKALVRDMHMTRNVARPENACVQNGNKVHQLPSKASLAPCKTISNAHKLARQLSTFSVPHTVNFDENAVFIEEDDASDTNTSSLDLSQSAPTCDKRDALHKGMATPDSNFAIPSVVITDLNESMDLITSTQRRFSQLYSGLRRLSTSHTVGGIYKIRFE